MSTPIINGTKKPQFNCEVVSFGPAAGDYSVTVTGPRDEVRNLIGPLVAAGASGTYRCDQSPVATIEYSFGSIDAVTGNPADEAPQNIWELHANEVEKDILEADIAFINNLSTSDKIQLQKWIDNPSQAIVFPDPFTPELETAYYEIIVARVRSVRVNQPTLRKSIVVSNRYQLKAALTDVRRIISTATLLTQEPTVTALLADLPAETPGGAGKENREYGWYKKFPQVQLTGLNRFSINQEWEYGLWSTLILGEVL